MGLKSIDLFAGCGGLSLGLERAGFETVFASEIHHHAMASYLINRTATTLSAPGNHAFDITAVTQQPGETEALARRLKREHGEIALVAGGPPCQGYSGIGHRRTFKLHKHEIPSNHLYRDHAAVVQAIAPRAFLFENVEGLLTSRWTALGQAGEIWRDVRKAFGEIVVRVPGKRAQLKYRFLSSNPLVRAADYGVPQNRPRLVFIGIREDIDIPMELRSYMEGFLPAPTHGAPDLIDLLDDLVDPDFLGTREMRRYPSDPLNDIQASFRTRPDGRLALMGDEVTEMVYSNHRPDTTNKFAHMIANDGEIPTHMQTKKFAQRVLPERWSSSGPSITATSLPDDYVHYRLPRTPTVREWARLQTFPDWYQFLGPRTTGGRRRAGDPSKEDWVRDVPKYTQIGNAVPVMLAQAIGEHIRKIVS